ncbi:type II toxin-antitoxin system TacA family antitoxin [Isoptericola rhizosphaerae]|uniref:type II toxin-antitoxin system TacA family antitoxin n=1 Tax=Isoptericola rhizosphaerae TaxID=3377837 RepID=UPI003839D132
MPTANARSERLNMRLSPDALATIRAAAAAQQQDVSAFVLGAAMAHAREVLLRDRVLQLTPRELDQVDSALDAEHRVVPELAALIAAVRRDAPQRDK